MNFSPISLEVTSVGKRIKFSVSLMVVLMIFITTILSIKFAIYINRRESIHSLAKIEEEVKETENQVQGEIEKQEEIMPSTPIMPVLTEIGIENFNNIYNADEKIAYLTFDDGPSKAVTPLILDILKENEVPATFFVLGSRVEITPSLVKRAYEEGHYIANHGYSHRYNDIYASKEAVLAEYNSTEIAIRNALEIQEYNSHMFRFPGGSTGNTKYSEVKNEAKQFLFENGIMYLDWNCLTGDSEGKYTKEALLEYLDHTSEAKGNVIVVLMHDGSDKILTAETLQDAINLLRSKGFNFRNLYSVIE